MLSPSEESFLKKFIKEHITPTYTPPSRPVRENAPVGASIHDALGKLPTEKMKAQDINDDHPVKLKLRDILRPFENLGQFYARTGLSRAQVLTLSEKEITRFIATHEANDDDVREPTQPSYKELVQPPPSLAPRRGVAVMVG